RRRVGEWLALLGACLILFFGPGWIDLLWSFQIGYTGAIAAGVAALLAIERNDRRGDALACLLLLLSITFSELAVPFAVGAFVFVLLDQPFRPIRLLVPLIPAGFYAA